MPPSPPNPTRRGFLTGVVGGACLGGLGVLLAQRVRAGETVWQIDPHKCTACGLCATSCVLEVSAAKCHHAFVMCGYCEECFGFFNAGHTDVTTGAENHLCPTDALKRKHVEGVYYEYHVDADECIGCAKCVKGCGQFGNQSLHLQIDQSRCQRCNECAIAIVCPANAISRIPARQPYLRRDVETPG